MLLRSKRKLTALLFIVLLLLPMLSGCSLREDSGNSRQLCEDFIDHVIANDYDAAYGMVSHVCSKDEFAPLWNNMRESFKDSSAYELKQTGWNKRLNNGITKTTVAFELVTDDEKICYVSIVTFDNIDGISGLHFLDSTEFKESTSFVTIINIVLTCIFIAGFVFTVWMFIDCIRRRVKRKVLWAIVILIGFGFSLTWGEDVFGFKLKLTLLSAMCNMVANLSSLSLTLNVALPIGAIVYFFMRKKLTLPPPEEVTAEPPTVSTEEDVSDNPISDGESSASETCEKDD